MGTIISALILLAAMWIVARHDADFSLPKVILIAFGVSILTALGGSMLGILILPIALVTLGWALMHFCYISLVQAAIVCGIWIAAQVGFSMLLSAAFSS